MSASSSSGPALPGDARPGRRRWLRRVGIGAAVTVGGLLLASFLLPLVVRGPRFAGLVHRFLPPLQGTIRFDGGSLGMTSLWAYAFGRPIPVRIEGLSVLDPEGTEVLRARELTTRLEVSRAPVRVVLHDLRPGKAMWRFARMKTRRGVGFLQAFRPLPRDATAGPPTPPPPRVPARPITPRGPGPAFIIASANLDGLDAIFDFWGWGLVLEDIRASGFLRVEFGTGRPPINFDVRDVDARRGGFLRILNDRRATTIPFDRAGIERVGTPAEAPANLLLVVSGALTQGARLSGRATFPALFPGRPAGAVRGLDVDATWENAGPGLTAAAASRGIVGLAIGGDKAHLRAKVASSFRDINGSFSTSGLDVAYRGFRVADLGFDLSLVGPPMEMAIDRLRFAAPTGGKVEGRGALSKDGAARFDLSVDGLMTAGLLPPYLHPMLGGTAVGALSLRGNLRERDATLLGIDLTLDRVRRGPWPRRLRVLAGKPALASALTMPRVPPLVGGEQLLVRLGGARFQRHRLDVDRLGVAFFGAEANVGPLTLSWPGLRGGEPGPAELDVRARVRNLDLRRALPGTALSGVVGFASRARGPLNDVETRVTFAPGAAITVFDQSYRLPAQARFGVRGGDELIVPRLALAAPGGGSLAVAGQLIVDRTVELSVDAVGHRLDRVPFVSRALPSLGGTLAARLRLSGHPRRPNLDGNVRLGGVTLAGVSLGDGAVRLVPVSPGHSAIKGAFFDRLTVAGNLAVGQEGPAFDATVDARALTLDPFLPELPLLRGGRLRVDGRLSLAANAGRPLELGAALDSVVFAYGCRAPTGDPRGPGCVTLENRGPLRARTRGGTQLVELARAQFSAGESDFSVEGRLDGGALDAELRGRFALGLLRPLFEIGGRRFFEASGVVDAHLLARGKAQSPVVTGGFEIVKPVRVSSTAARLELRLPEGQLSFTPGRVSSRGLRLEMPGIKLAVAGEAAAPDLVGGRSASPTAPLSVDLSGTVDASILNRLFPALISEASGEMAIEGQVRGSLAKPSLDGDVRLGAMSFTMRRQEGVPRRLRVSVAGGRISARGTRVTVDELSALVEPGGRLVVGPRGQPAVLELLSLSPPTLGRVSVPVVGRGLNGDLGWLRLDDGSLDLRLEGDARGALALSGAIELGAGRISPTKRPRPAPAKPAAPAPRDRSPRPQAAGPPPMKLDLRLHGDGQRFVVDPGWLPDLHLGFDVRIGGTVAKPAVKWDAQGRGAYSTFALFLFRLFS